MQPYTSIIHHNATAYTHTLSKKHHKLMINNNAVMAKMLLWE